MEWVRLVRLHISGKRKIGGIIIKIGAGGGERDFL